MFIMYGCVVEALHHTPSDVGERSVQIEPGNPASGQSETEFEHNCGDSFV